MIERTLAQTSMYEPHTTILDLGTVHVGLRVCGDEDGDLLLALPGLGRGAGDFDPLARHLAAGGRRVIAIEPRGIGGSAAPVAGATLEDHARDAARVIERLGRPVTVVGHTFGGRVARMLAHRWPARVERVVLLAAGGLVPPDPETVAQARRLMGLIADGMPATATEEALAMARQLYFAPSGGPPGDVPPDGWLQAFSPSLLAAQRSASHATPGGPWLSGGSAPMVIIQGADDRIAPPENGRRLAEELGKRVTLHELANAGHFLLLERPRTIASILLALPP